MNWQNILKSKTNPDFQKFLIEIFGIPRAVARKLSPSKSLTSSLGYGKLTEAITENEFEELINLAEAEQYENLLERLEEINSNYAVSQRKKFQRTYRERVARDPEYREKENRRARERRRKKKEEK